MVHYKRRVAEEKGGWGWEQGNNSNRKNPCSQSSRSFLRQEISVQTFLILAYKWVPARPYHPMGPLQLAVTWYKIHHAGEQATHWDIQNKENANLS